MILLCFSSSFHRFPMSLFSFFFSSRRRHTRSDRDWSSDVCSSDLDGIPVPPRVRVLGEFSPIRPDSAPIAVPLIQVNHLVRGLHELDDPQFIKLHAREPDRITLVQWIIGKPGGDLS